MYSDNRVHRMNTGWMRVRNKWISSFMAWAIEMKFISPPFSPPRQIEKWFKTIKSCRLAFIELFRDETNEKYFLLGKTYVDRLLAIFYCWRNCYSSPLCVVFSPIINHPVLNIHEKVFFSLFSFLTEHKMLFIFIFRLLANDISINLYRN